MWLTIYTSGVTDRWPQIILATDRSSQPRSHHKICGSAISDTVCGALPPKRAFLFSMVHKDTSDDDIKQYIIDKDVNSVELTLI